MTFFVYSGQPRDYDSLGFSVTNGQILDGTLSDPEVTSPPDANWSVTGSGPETVTRHGQNPGGTPSPPEPTDGYILRYSDADNAYVATDPQGFVELTPVADAIVGKINELSAPKWKASTAYMEGDTVLAPDGSPVKTKVARTSSGSYSTTPASPPVLGAPTTATTGGTIAAGTTYYYKATALSAIGETLASAEVSRVIAAALATPVLDAPTTATTGGTLAAGTYYYKITATNAIGETVGSNEVSQATTGTTSTVGLSWAAITDATGYKIYRATTAGGQSTSPALVESVGAVTSYTDTGTAVSAGAVPATNTTATSTNTVGLSWAAVTGATGYKIYRATTTGGQSTSPALLATLGAVTSYTDTGSATTAGSVPTTNTANERAFWQSVNTYAGTQAETELSASFNAMPEVYIDPRTLDTGAIRDLSFGDFIASYGNSPASVSGGRITHTPTTGSNSAAYIEGRVSGQVGRMGMEIEWPSGSDGTFALVIPHTGGWSGNPTPGDSGIHATVRADGVISCGRYVGGALEGTQTTNLGAQTGRHSFEVLVDSIRQEITVLFDGVQVLRYIDATAFSYVSDRVIWELFQSNGTSGTPGYIRAAWGDTEKIIPAARAATSLERVRKGYAANFSDAASINLPTTYRATLGIGTLGVYYPPSGRLMCSYDAWVTANGLATNRRIYGSIASAADQALAWGGQIGRLTCRMVVTGTPGALAVLSPQMWAEDASGTVTVVISGTSGISTMSAVPVEAVI